MNQQHISPTRPLLRKAEKSTKSGKQANLLWMGVGRKSVGSRLTRQRRQSAIASSEAACLCRCVCHSVHKHAHGNKVENNGKSAELAGTAMRQNFLRSGRPLQTILTQ